MSKPLNPIDSEVNPQEPPAAGSEWAGDAEWGSNDVYSDSSIDTPKKRGVFRKVGRGLYKLTAADVLIRDSKRIRLRYPHLWRDVASGKWRKTDPRMEKKSLPAVWLTPILLWGITLALGLYALAMFMEVVGGQDSMDSLSVIGLVTVWLAALFQSGSYTYIAWAHTKRRKT